MRTTLETQRMLQESAKLQLALESDPTVNDTSYQDNVPSPTAHHELDTSYSPLAELGPRLAGRWRKRTM